MRRLLAICLAVASLVIAKAMADEFHSKAMAEEYYRWPTEEEFIAAKHPHDISYMAPKYWNFNDQDDRTTEIGVAIGAGICLVPYLTYCALCSTVLLFAQPFCGPQFLWTCWVCGMFRPECVAGQCPLPSLPG